MRVTALLEWAENPDIGCGLAAVEDAIEKALQPSGWNSQTQSPALLSNLQERGIDPQRFVGRETDLKHLHDCLNSHRKVAIVGMFGLGKTELAIQYARAYKADYPGGVGWFPAATFGEALYKWIEAELDRAPDFRHLEPEQRVLKAWKEWRDFCAQRPALVIVDDVTDYRQQIAPYLPPNEDTAAPFRFVFTSRSAIPTLQPLDLPQLALPAALQLLECLAGTARIQADVATADAVCNRLGAWALPLALTLMGSWLNIDPDRTVADLSRALDEQGLDAPALDRNPDDILTAERGVKAAFAISWAQLNQRSPEGAQLARVLTLFAPVDLPWDLIDTVINTYTQEYVLPARTTAVAPPEPSGLQKLWQSFWRWLQRLFGKRPSPTRPAPPPLHPVNDSLEARGHLLRLNLLECVRRELPTPELFQVDEAGISPAVAVPPNNEGRGGSAVYRLHPLLRELFAEQWPGFDHEHWQLAFALAIAAEAEQVPKQVDVETASQFEPLKAHFALAEAILKKQQKATAATLPSVAERYKVATRQIRAADFRLSYRVMFATRFEQAQKIYDEAKAAAAAGQKNLASQKFAEAIENYQKVVEDTRRALSPHSLPLAGYLNRLAGIFRDLGQYNKGIPLAEEAVQIAEIRQIRPVKLAIYLNNLAILYGEQGRYGEAEPLQLRSLHIREQQFGSDHPDVAQSLNNLAELYRNQGRYHEGESLSLRSLHIREQQLGADHLQVASSLNTLATLYCALGRYDEGVPFALRSLRIREQHLGADHPDVAQSLNNLAELYRPQGRFGEAETLYQRALYIQEQQLGTDHPIVAISLNNLAELYLDQERYIDAETIYLRSLHIREHQLGINHPLFAQSLNNLGGLHHVQRRYGKAEPFYIRATEIFIKTLPAGHPEITGVQNNFAGMIRAALAAGQADQLSDHPTTQGVLRQIQEE
jgi:tetratricopeptide (TPR) repeat protein